MTVPKVAGLDLSMTATGVAHTQTDGTGCTHLVKPAGKGDARLVEIRRQVLAYCQWSELVLVEGWLVRSQSAPITGMVHGAVRSGLVELGLKYGTVPPGTLKKYATGSGTAPKTAMAVAAYKRAGLEFTDDNQCDAWWLWAMALDHLGLPVVELPKTQREALGKIKMEG